MTVLARLEAFLPELKRANETLDVTEASIEKEDANGEEEDDHHNDDSEDMQGGGESPRIEMVSGCRISRSRKLKAFDWICRVLLLFACDDERSPGGWLL